LKPGKDGASEATTAQRSAVHVQLEKLSKALRRKAHVKPGKGDNSRKGGAQVKRRARASGTSLLLQN
jgi:hypothetical protein